MSSRRLAVIHSTLHRHAPNGRKLAAKRYYQGTIQELTRYKQLKGDETGKKRDCLDPKRGQPSAYASAPCGFASDGPLDGQAGSKWPATILLQALARSYARGVQRRRFA